MVAAGQICFVLGMVLTFRGNNQRLSVSHGGWNISGSVGPVLIVLGLLMWLVF